MIKFLRLLFLLIACMPSMGLAQQTDSLQKFINEYPFLDANQKQMKAEMMEMVRKSQLSQQYFAMADALYDQSNYDQAISYYDSALVYDSSNSRIYNNLGNTYHNLKQYTNAIACFNIALALDPNNKVAYCNRANSYSHCGQNDAATRDYTMAITLDSDNYINYYNRGCFYMKIDLYDSAIKDYKYALFLNANYPYPINNIAYIHLKQAKFNEAIKGFEHFIALTNESNDGYGNAFYDMGFAYYEKKRYYLAAINAEFGEYYKANNLNAFIQYKDIALHKMFFWNRWRYKKFKKALQENTCFN